MSGKALCALQHGQHMIVSSQHAVSIVKLYNMYSVMMVEQLYYMYLYNMYYEESVSQYGIIEYVRTSVVMVERLRCALNETHSICMYCKCHVIAYRTFVAS